jgi:Histidine kinase
MQTYRSSFRDDFAPLNRAYWARMDLPLRIVSARVSPNTPWAISDQAIATLPVLAAVLLAALDQQQAAQDPGLDSFVQRLGLLLLGCLPLMAAHLFARRQLSWPAFIVWLTGFGLYPAVLLEVVPAVERALLPATRFCILAALLSALALLFQQIRIKSLNLNRLAALVARWPITLDGAVIALLGVWTLATTALFASTPDAVNNQPLRIWLDPVQIATYPVEALGYFLQFSGLSLLLFGFYCGARYLLVRRVMRDHGGFAFSAALLAYWVAVPPLLGTAILALPINTPDWSLLPSEDHNPFDPLNYGFAAILLAIALPIILASERLLSERSTAIRRHEQARAELETLQQQINPHFLFNALNALYALCLEGRGASAGAVLKLSDLLRYTVYDGQKEWAGLDDEISYLRNYIDLQLLRFGQRCRVSCTWPEEPSRFVIPPLLLIMLVENAFKHGVEPGDETSEVNITLTIIGTRLRFTCANSTVLDMQPTTRPGLGLANLRRRLELLFGERFVLVSASRGSEWEAMLELDLRLC